MPISALPIDTVRVIGASQALTDSASLVKEVSNSLGHSYSLLGNFPKFKTNICNHGSNSITWLIGTSPVGNTDSKV